MLTLSDLIWTGRRWEVRTAEGFVGLDELLDIGRTDPVHAAGGRYCWECRYHTYDTTFDRHWCNRTTGSCEVKSNGFCSHGKRREGEAHERTD